MKDANLVIRLIDGEFWTADRRLAHAVQASLPWVHLVEWQSEPQMLSTELFSTKDNRALIRKHCFSYSWGSARPVILLVRQISRHAECVD